MEKFNRVIENLNYFRYALGKAYDCELETHEIMAFELAISSCEKQIPMKVKHPINSDGEENKKVTYCYKCGTNVKNQLYCHNCGQKLLWE